MQTIIIVTVDIAQVVLTVVLVLLIFILKENIGWTMVRLKLGGH